MNNRAQLAAPFMLRTAVAFALMVAIIYAMYSMEDNLKERSQKQALIAVAEYIGTETLDVFGYLGENQSSYREMRIPLSKDFVAGQYSVRYAAVGNQLFVEVRSTKWPENVARQPLFLNASAVYTKGRAYPPGLCIDASRNETGYILNMTCR